MKAWRWVGALVLVGAVAMGVKASGDKTGDGMPQFKALENIGKPFWQEMTTNTVQEMKVSGMQVMQTQKQTFYVKWTPKTWDKDKNVGTVDYEIVGVKMDIQIGGNNISYDSTVTQPPDNPLTQFFKALVGSKFVFTIAKDANEGYKVTNVGEISKFVDKLAAANDSLKSLLQAILSEDALKQMSNPTFAAFPKSEKDYKEGKWDTGEVDMKMGPIGSYKTKYTYEKDAKDSTRIRVTGTMTYSPPKLSEAQGLPFTIKGGDLKSTKISGEVTIKDGRIAESKMNMTLKGELKIDIAGMETTVVLDQTQDSTLKSFDNNPLPDSAAKKAEK